jgi:hypothetical protein
MSRPLTVRKPRATELRRVHQWLEGPLQAWQRRRAEVLLLYAAGLSASAMAQLLQVHVNTVYADLRDFAEHGLSFLRRSSRVHVAFAVRSHPPKNSGQPPNLGSFGLRQAPIPPPSPSEEGEVSRSHCQNGRIRRIHTRVVRNCCAIVDSNWTYPLVWSFSRWRFGLPRGLAEATPAQLPRPSPSAHAPKRACGKMTTPMIVSTDRATRIRPVPRGAAGALATSPPARRRDSSAVRARPPSCLGPRRWSPRMPSRCDLRIRCESGRGRD